MKAALLSFAVVAGLALSSGTASAQGRGYGHYNHNRGFSNAPFFVTPVYRAPLYVAPVVNPYNAGLYDLNRVYGPNYYTGGPQLSGGFLGFSAGNSMGYNSGYFPSYRPAYGYGRRW
jgi:hypothetical protein